MDEYDTPMQEAYVNGFWEELVNFTRTLFNSTFKTNPWSILNFLDTGKFDAYWANISSNSLVGKLMREGSPHIKETFEQLIQGGTLQTSIDEQIVYNQLEDSDEAAWSPLLASGYLKVLNYEENAYSSWEDDDTEPLYELALTNLEVRRMFRSIIRGWFAKTGSNYNDFVKALLMGNVRAINTYINRVALQTFSYFDTDKNPSYTEPERFYHGFVLGLMVELGGKYAITSNRESGFAFQGKQVLIG